VAERRGRRLPGVLPGLLLVLAPAVFGATHTVVIDGMRFQPEALTARRGDRIVWVNRDVVPHTATAKGAFDSAVIPPGASWATTVGRRGHHEVVCTLHPMMKSSLDVK